MLKVSDKTDVVRVLRNGGVAIFPTDTVYGIGCKIDDGLAIERLYEIKRRAANQPVPVLLHGSEQLKDYMTSIPEGIDKLIETYWPGALTIVLPILPHTMLPILHNERGSVSFRVPNHAILRDIIKDVGVPVIGTSANFHGEPTPRKVSDLNFGLEELVDCVLLGECGLEKESTVIEKVGNEVLCHREASIPFQEIIAVMGKSI